MASTSNERQINLAIHAIRKDPDLIIRRAARGPAPRGEGLGHKFFNRPEKPPARFFRRDDHSRAQCEDPDAIRAWFALVKNTITKYGVVDADIYNFDETGFIMGIISTGMVVTSMERRSNAKLAQPGNGEGGTF